jgi:hypothetical protein
MSVRLVYHNKTKQMAGMTAAKAKRLGKFFEAFFTTLAEGADIDSLPTFAVKFFKATKHELSFTLWDVDEALEVLGSTWSPIEEHEKEMKEFKRNPHRGTLGVSTRREERK